MGIAPIISKSASGKKLTTYLVTDANIGVIPCATLDQAIEVLKITAASYLGEGAVSPNLSDLRVAALPINDAVAAILKDPTKVGINDPTITRPDGSIDLFRYTDMFDQSDPPWTHWAKHHDASDSSSWSKLLPAELAKRSVDAGDNNNLKSGLKERFGTGPDDVLIRKTPEIMQELLNVGANRQAGCLTGTCSVDFAKYYDGADSPFVPKVPDRSPLSNAGLLGQQLGDSATVQQASGPGDPIYSNIRSSAADDDPIYGNVKKHQPLRRKKVIKKKAKPKVSFDELYDTAKPVLGLSLPDDVYANVISSADKNGIVLADGDADAFKLAAKAAGQDLTDEDIWGEVGI
ncbi:MAG: hypothetical protein ACRDAP_07490, partial [Shewanella sp.]